jgi:two-component system sensor histidine kinase CiaH
MRLLRRRAPAADPDAASVRRVGWRLAALTVALVSVLLLLSGVLVYLNTQQALLTSLQDTLQSRALNPPDCIRHVGRPCPSQDSQGVAYTVFDLNLTIVNYAGPFSTPLIDVGSAQLVVQTGNASGYVKAVHDHVDYLLYTVPLVAPETHQVLGVVQTSISEQQYKENLGSLRRVLLIISLFGIAASAAISGVLARRALKPIQASLKRQRDFVADAAHELRTPLTIMRTAAELGLADESMAEQQRALEQTLDQNNHLLRLVESLSLLARADSGAVAIEHLPVDFTQLVHDGVESVDMLAEDRGIHLTGRARPGMIVLGDAGRLRQLLLILLDNALKYSPEGSEVLVTAEVQGANARLQVRDTGPGIDPTALPRLFERFYRADKARSGTGTGLGLAIARWIVDAHNGRVTAANAPGGGALFTVLLPLAR